MTGALGWSMPTDSLELAAFQATGNAGEQQESSGTRGLGSTNEGH